jgi:hypothetical protein
MIWLYDRLPGNRTMKIAIATVLVLVVLAAVIWSYEVLGDLLDSGGTVGA